MNDKSKDLYDLLDKSLKNKKYTQYKKTDLTEGEIEKVGENYLIVKIDGVYDALVPSGEMIKGEDVSYKVGDKVKVFVLKAEDEYGNMIVSQKRTTVGQRWDMLEEAAKNDLPVIVTVMESNNGGVIVNVDGVSGFIPTSQLDPNKVYKLDVDPNAKDAVQKEISRKLADLVGTKVTVKIVEIDKEKNKVIFSERLALTDQSAELRSQTIKNARIGDEMDAIVTAVTAYGVFVNAEGLDGLVHVSEISWDKVENPADFVKVGDKVKVKLIDMSDDLRRVAYSMKQLSDDPWNEVSQDYKVGGKVHGTVTEIEDYGVILKIGDGVTGLIHKSELSDKIIGDPKDHVKIGEEIEAVILTISPSERKMGLSVKRLNDSKASFEGGSKSSRGGKRPERKKVPGSLDIAGALAKAGITAEVDESEAEEVETTPEVKEEKPAKVKKATKAKKEAVEKTEDVEAAEAETTEETKAEDKE